ncbi:hypothetical protein [Snodgrassella gandavensis]|uniref:hypothetical protein n=1 Tax=Snodgrassella gandavensis TaxID=2946698 RepID=UPI001EF4F265|nr:hypothetical protein [Snodgrassella gandavensis]
MTTSVDFKQVLLEAFEKNEAKAKEGELKEVFAVLERLASEIEAAVNGLLKAWIPMGELGGGLPNLPYFKGYRVELKSTRTGEQRTLMRCDTHVGGYPFDVIYKSSVNPSANKVKKVNNKEEFECALAEMLESSAIVERISSLMNEQRTVNGD